MLQIIQEILNGAPAIWSMVTPSISGIQSQKDRLGRHEESNPFCIYANISKVAEVIVLAWQDTSTRKGRDESTDMSIQTHIYCPLLHCGNNILQLRTANTIYLLLVCKVVSTYISFATHNFIPNTFGSYTS